MSRGLGDVYKRQSMWYLLNKQAYPFIIFNRAISLNKEKYYKIIRDIKKYRNMTYFLNYMLENVKLELEKEYIIDMIKSCSSKLSAVDNQTLYYILSMNGLKSVKDFINFYNLHNDKKTSKEIYEQMLQPLLDRGIILKQRDTSSFINDVERNFVFKLNPSKFENNPDKIKKLKLKQ